jgi:phenylacetaldehyde dehydrogenase
LETFDPANGHLLAHVASGGSADVDAAVTAARAAFDNGPWPRMTPAQRGKILWRVAELIEEHLDELAALETLDSGKPFWLGRYAEIPVAAEQFRFFAGMTGKIMGQTIPSNIDYQPEGKLVKMFTTKEPVGVVAAITPWNAPIIMHAMKLAPALAAGCTIILKPAEDTPLTAIRLVELMEESGIPAGVVNLVTGYGAVAGEALAQHGGVDKIAFTGSAATARHILSAAQGNLKRVSLELGGKSPVIILPDADLDAAIQGAAMAIFANSGQVCVAGSRVYAHQSIHAQVLAGIAAAADALTLGHGLDPHTKLGPLINRRQADRVTSMVERGVADGATIVAGGTRVNGTDSFFHPTVMTGTRIDMEIAQEEIFGPVVAVESYANDADSITIANATRYGLGASVWTNDLSAAHRMAAAIKAGTVWINCHSFWDPALPFGGFRQSGWGRESGVGAVESYLEGKSICMVI